MYYVYTCFMQISIPYNNDGKMINGSKPKDETSIQNVIHVQAIHVDWMRKLKSRGTVK